MAGRRRYGEACGISHALDLVGERWSLLVVRDLVLGPKRFSDLQAGLPGAGANILAQRLRELEAVGVVRRRTLAPPAGSRVYELTDWGAELGPVLQALGMWGARSPVVALEGGLGPDSVALRLRAAFPARVDPGWTAGYELRIGRERFAVTVADGELVEFARGEARDPVATLETDPVTLDALLDGATSAADAERSGQLSITGDRAVAERLLIAARRSERGEAVS